MRRTRRRASVLSLVLLLAALAGCRASLPEGEPIGEELVVRPIHPLAEVVAAPASFQDRTLLVEADVVAVCERAGCWMKVADGASTAMVRWEEGCGGAYTFPTFAVGRRVLVQGSFYPKTISEEDAAHLAEEAGGDVAFERETHELNASAVLVLAR